MGKAGTRRQCYPRCIGRLSTHTVSQDELGNSSEVHGNATEEVVVTTQTDQTCRSDGTLEAAEDEDSGCVRYEEADQAEQGWIG